jgi:hypothetical protein
MSTRDRIKDMRNFYVRMSIYAIVIVVGLYVLGENNGLYPEKKNFYNGVLIVMVFLVVGPCLVDAFKYQKLFEKENKKLKEVDNLIQAIKEEEDE